jgi:hypothetical protein
VKTTDPLTGPANGSSMDSYASEDALCNLHYAPHDLRTIKYVVFILGFTLFSFWFSSCFHSGFHLVFIPVSPWLSPVACFQDVSLVGLNEVGKKTTTSDKQKR